MIKTVFAFLAIFGVVFAIIWNLKQVLGFIKEYWFGICIALLSVISTFVIVYTA